MVVGRMSDSDDLEVAEDLLNQADGSVEQVTVEDSFPPFPWTVACFGG